MMRDSFVTPVFVLDLRNIKMSFVEQNPMFKDSFSTKYSFPFEFHLNRDLKVSVGNYSNLNALELNTKYDGYHVFEGKANKAILEILEIEGELVRAQIDSGFDEFPNFQKKLSELNLHKKEVLNIYTHANDVCVKKYPEVDYNFPKVIYDKHSSDENGWEIFNQFINDYNDNGFVTNNEFSEDGVGTSHKNRNIIQPMPYLLYVLKQGFLDAGYELIGDILKDKDFKQRVLFSNSEYFLKNEKPPQFLKIEKEDSSKKISDTHLFKYEKKITLENVGSYRLQGVFDIDGYFETNIDWTKGLIHYPAVLSIFSNGSLIFKKKTVGRLRSNIDLEFRNNVNQGVLTIELVSLKRDVLFDSSISLESFLNKNGDSIFKIINSNKIDLTRSVPNMTFGELVTQIKNWKNYDLDVEEDKVVMNKLKKESIDNVIKDISSFESKNPVKKFRKKRSYSIGFEKMDDESNNLDSIYIDANGVKMNGRIKEDTNKVTINGYCLPLRNFKGNYTAEILRKDSNCVSLIYYDGLTQGSNLAKNPPGLTFPELQTALIDWYKNRIESSEIKWSFIVNKNKFKHINIRDVLYAYNKNLRIKEMNKNIINERFSQIDIVTEVIK